MKSKSLNNTPRSTQQSLAALEISVPVSLLLSALIAFLLQEERSFIAAAFVGAICSIYSGYLILFRFRQIRLNWILANGLLLGYSLGSFNSAFRLLLSGIPVSEYFARSQSDLSKALAVTLLVSAILFYLGAAFEKPIRIDVTKLQNHDFAIVWVLFSLTATALLTGGLGFMGISSSNTSHRESVFGALAGAVSPALPALIILLQTTCRRYSSLLISWILLFAAIASLGMLGRRFLIYGLLLAGLAYCLKQRDRRINLDWRTVVLAVGAIPIFWASNLFFYAMRVSAWQSGTETHSISYLAPKAVQLLEGGVDDRFGSQISENVRDRTFVLAYFSDLLAASWTHSPVYGRDLLFCIESAFPSKLFDKRQVENLGMEEALVNPQFGLFVVDDANSILTAGVSDFGILGAVMYPIALTFLMSLFLRHLISSRKLPEVLRDFLLFSVVGLLWQEDRSSGDYFVITRDLLIVLLPLLLVSKWNANGKMKRVSRAELGPPARFNAQVTSSLR